MSLMYEFMMVISDQNINLILLSDIIQKDSCQRIGSVFLSVQPFLNSACIWNVLKRCYRKKKKKPPNSEKVQYSNTFWFRQRLILKLESVFEGGKKLSFFLYPSNLSLLYWIDSKMWLTYAKGFVILDHFPIEKKKREYDR